MLRRAFIKQFSSAIIILKSGQMIAADDFLQKNKRPVLRFVVASDGHYGQKDTDYEVFFKTTIDRINAEHALSPFNFGVINGDIIHDDKKWFVPAKKAIDRLVMPYYVSQGNHDHVDAAEWQSIWNMPVNLEFKIKKNSVLIGTTSNIDGSYLCPDLAWFEKALAIHKASKNIFIFIHINPGKQTANAVDCPAFFDLLAKYKNVRAIFNGHDHDQDQIKTKNNIPFLFDSHMGGSWGTDYRGFRIVELHRDNSLLTYILNPLDKLHEVRL